MWQHISNKPQYAQTQAHRRKRPCHPSEKPGGQGGVGQGRTDNNLECRGPSLSSAAWRRVFRACANTAEPRGCEAGHDGETSKRHPIRSCRAVVVVITSPHATLNLSDKVCTIWQAQRPLRLSVAENTWGLDLISRPSLTTPTRGRHAAVPHFWQDHVDDCWQMSWVCALFDPRLLQERDIRNKLFDHWI